MQCQATKWKEVICYIDLECEKRSLISIIKTEEAGWNGKGLEPFKNILCLYWWKSTQQYKRRNTDMLKNISESHKHYDEWKETGFIYMKFWEHKTKKEEKWTESR